MNPPNQSQIEQWLEKIKKRPSSYHLICKRHRITPRQLDTYLQEYVDKEEFENFESRFHLKYGIYPTYLSIVTLKTMREEVDLPLVPTVYAAEQYGTAEDLLDHLDIPYFRVFDSVFTRNHFYRMFDIKDPRYFCKKYENNNRQFVQTCDELDIDIRSIYRKMAKETAKVYENAHKISKKTGGTPESQLVDVSEESKDDS